MLRRLRRQNIYLLYLSHLTFIWPIVIDIQSDSKQANIKRNTKVETAICVSTG